MDIALVVILLLVAAIVGWYDRSAVQRAYADVYAARHGRIPPLIEWFFTADADPRSSIGGARTATSISS